MTNPFKKRNHYQEFKQWCASKKVQSVVGLGYTPQDTYNALTKFQNQLKLQKSR